MTTTRLLAACSPGEIRIAVLRDDELLDYAIWRPGAPDGIGDLHRGRVIARAPAMAGCFIALHGTEGFLPFNESPTTLHEGDFVSVRVTRAAQGGKGPRLTARLSAGEVPPARGPGPLLELATLHADAAVLIDDAGAAARLKPALGERLRVVAMAFAHDLEEQVEALGQPDVALRNGMRLHVHPTPALTAIDVDAGSAVAARKNKTASHLATNLAMLPALTRQIRLRNLSGAILVDFAGLSARRRATLAPALESALADDPLRPRLLGFTSLGLAEIVRPRVHPPLHELLAGPHAAGLVALRRIAGEAAARPHIVPILRASPAIAAALERDTEALADLARRLGRALIVQADPNLPATGWTIEAKDG